MFFIFLHHWLWNSLILQKIYWVTLTSALKGIATNSLLISLLALFSTTMEIEPCIVNGCHCPLSKTPKPLRLLKTICLFWVHVPPQPHHYPNGLLSFPPAVPSPLGSHTCPPSTWDLFPQLLESSLSLTPASASAFTSFRNDPWWS